MPPVTIAIIMILFLIYFSVNNYDTGNELLNYQLRSFYHADMSHLIANCISFYALSPIESVIGWQKYIGAILFIWISSSILLYGYHKIVPSQKVHTVGFSGIVFGLTVLYFSIMRQNPSLSVIGLFVSILPQIFVPGISFEGHISGIISGIIFILIFPQNKKITM